MPAASTPGGFAHAAEDVVHIFVAGEGEMGFHLSVEVGFVGGSFEKRAEMFEEFMHLGSSPF